MKHITAISVLMLSASIASADGYARSDYAVVTGVYPVYAERYVERYDTQCRNVEVPVYGSARGGSDGDVLAGAIIGGTIGNQFGNGSGKDAMTILGAIIGANKGANSRHDVITGYRLEQQCENTRVLINEPVITHYNVQYTLDGIEYYQETSHKHILGEHVKVSVYLK